MTSAASLPLKRARRPLGRDTRKPGLVAEVHSFAYSSTPIELCADLPHLSFVDDLGGRVPGRPPELPPEVLVIFGYTAALLPGDRRVEAFLSTPTVWEPIRGYFAQLFPAYKGLRPGATGPSRSQFQRWYTKIGSDTELLARFTLAFETTAADSASMIGLLDPARHTPSNPDIRDTLIGDGTVLKSRFKAVPGDTHLDPDTGEIVPRRSDPDATVQHRKSPDDSPVTRAGAGTNFGFFHATTGHPDESIMTSVFYVPEGPGKNEALAAINNLKRLRRDLLLGCDHLLYDKAMRGVHIDQALQLGIQLHAKVSLRPGGKDKERLVDTQLPAKRRGTQVGAVDVYALRGAAHISVPVPDGTALVMLQPRQVRERPNANGARRVYRDYGIPDDARVPPHLRGAVVSVRHDTSDEDRRRGLNRAEVLRLIAIDHPDWPLVAQRSRAESLNAQMKNRWQNERAPAVGKERQQLRLMFAALGVNHRATLAYQRRTGIKTSGNPPPTEATAA